MERTGVDDLLLLPREFLEAYSHLFHDALKDGGTGAGSEVGKIGGRGYRSGWLVRDERALERKRYVDRQLRDLARRIRRGEWKDADQAVRCQCGSWLGAEVRFCSRCGAQRGDPAVAQEGGG